MKKCILFAALGLIGCAALAQESARVVSATPIVQQVAVPRQVCSQQQMMVQQPQSSGGGAVIGAIVGGILGNTIGHGFGRAAATGAGVMAGAVVGNSVETGGNRPMVSGYPSCTTQTSYENRTVGYNVTYEHGGTQHTVQMPYDPGPTVQLQVSPVGSSSMPSPNATGYPVRPAPQPLTHTPMVPSHGYAPSYPPVYSQGFIDQSVTVLPAYPPSMVIYPAYAYRPAYYPSYFYPGVSLSIGYSRGWRGHRGHRHWR